MFQLVLTGIGVVLIMYGWVQYEFDHGRRSTFSSEGVMFFGVGVFLAGYCMPEDRDPSGIFVIGVCGIFLSVSLLWNRIKRTPERYNFLFCPECLMRKHRFVFERRTVHGYPFPIYLGDGTFLEQALEQDVCMSCEFVFAEDYHSHGYRGVGIFDINEEKTKKSQSSR